MYVKSRRRLTENDWKGIRDLYVTGAATGDNLAKQFGIEGHTLRKRASREAWTTPFKVAKQAVTIRGKVVQAKDIINRVSQSKGIEPIKVDQSELSALNWEQKGEKQRSIVFDLAIKALQRLQNRPEPLEIVDWQDAERADKMARRAAGLDSDEQSIKVNVNLALVNQRLEQIGLEMPADAVEL